MDLQARYGETKCIIHANAVREKKPHEALRCRRGHISLKSTKQHSARSRSLDLMSCCR
ncbi:Hypothetical predicted protein [Prunus dulcis]|uniref:Uncharacterized protein n=1 Tax=Prunus dulcis TaxID=3755 RepID=A0A5E4GB54_PRUDU|nr:Hypothetical predicted protein [Prunus dulcis]